MEKRGGLTMQNIKNFRKTDPTPAQREADLEATGNVYDYYVSEDGLDWYECQSLFSDDTIKIMYDSEGIIRSLVAEPVARRGGVLAVSALPSPDGFSVAEVEGPLPDGCSVDGDWMFDGQKILPVPVDNVAVAEKLKARLMREAEVIIAPLQRAVKYGLATDAEKQLLEQWEVYTVLLSRVDTSLAPDVEWPPVPV